MTAIHDFHSPLRLILLDITTLFPLLYLYVLCLPIFHPPRGPLVVGKRKRQPSHVFSVRPYVSPSDSPQGSSTASDNCILLRLCVCSPCLVNNTRLAFFLRSIVRPRPREPTTGGGVQIADALVPGPSEVRPFFPASCALRRGGRRHQSTFVMSLQDSITRISQLGLGANFIRTLP